jgi:hypothetical protein
MANDKLSETVLPKAPVTEPVVEAPVAPAIRQKKIERQGEQAVPFVHRMPEVRGGTCEWCGVMDPNLPSEYQYKLCPHFRGLQLRCSYCDETKNPDDIIGHSILNIYEHPDNPDKLVVVCNSYDCTRKHRARFSTSE